MVGQGPRQGLTFGRAQTSVLTVKETATKSGTLQMFPQLGRFTDLGLLLLRLMVGVVFVTSGYSHLKNPEPRAKSIEMSKAFTIVLGIGELAGGLGVAFGVLTQLAAIGLILIMFGAIQKKIFSWHTGFWGEKSSGWHYDLMLVLMSTVILFTNGGSYVLVK